MMLKTPKQIAKEYGFSESHIRKLIHQGRIKAEKVGRHYVINSNCSLGIKRRRKLNRTIKDENHGSHK